MAAEDELALPQVPEARPDDPEDVSWSLSTAEAMWARGDHLEGIKWVRKAAEAASEVEDDLRALELAKAASELATIVARRSQASAPQIPPHAAHETMATAAPPPDASFADTSNSVPVSVQQPVSAMPTTTRSQMPAPPPTPVSLPPMAPSSNTGATGARTSTQPTSRPMSQPPPRAPLTSSRASSAPRPLSGSNNPPPRFSDRPQPPQASKSPPKPRRKSRDNIDLEAPEARAASNDPSQTAPRGAVDADSAAEALEGERRDLDATAIVPTPFASMRPASRPPRRKSNRPASEPEATVIARLEDLEAQREKSAAALQPDWDRSPTKSAGAAELDLLPEAGAPPMHDLLEEETNETDRKTAFVGTSPVAFAPVNVTSPAGSNHANHGASRPAQPAVHDPAIQTTQAVRVVVWRDANGVHVAPAGTVVSAIAIDAVLVVLAEGADLTAWLSQRER